MKIKLIFTNNINTHDEDFILADNPVSNTWIKKIKHLCNIKIDPIYKCCTEFRLNGTYSMHFSLPVWKWCVNLSI